MGRSGLIPRETSAETAVCFVQAENVFSAKAMEKLMILNADTEQFHELNLTAEAIWNALATPRTEADVVAILLDTFEIAEVSCAKYVKAFIEALLSRNLVVRHEVAEGA